MLTPRPAAVSVVGDRVWGLFSTQPVSFVLDIKHFIDINTSLDVAYQFDRE